MWKTPITPGTAAILTQLMIGVAERGTASCCIALEGGIPVAAKTGTAQLNAAGEPERSHVWITAFAPADAPKYAVVVMLKGTDEEISAGTGGRVAGPIAKAMLDAIFAADAAAAARRRPTRRPSRPQTRTTEPAPDATTELTPSPDAADDGGRSRRMSLAAVTVNLRSRSITSDNVPRSTSSTGMGRGRQNQ